MTEGTSETGMTQSAYADWLGGSHSEGSARGSVQA